jgi:hypothetical protein
VRADQHDVEGRACLERVLDEEKIVRKIFCREREIS